MIRKRPDGRWEGRIVVGHKENGDPIFRYVSGKTQKELLPKLHQQIEMYRDVELVEDSNLTLSEWMERWLVLLIIDDKDQIAENLSTDSFISGFRLAWRLANELNYYEKVHPILTRERVSSDALSVLFKCRDSQP